MKVVEDFESRTHKAVIFVVERDKEIQEWRGQKMPKAVPGFSGEKLSGSSKAEKGKEEEDEGKEDQKRQMRSDVTKEIVASVLKEADTVGGGVTGNTGPISQTTDVTDLVKAVEIGMEHRRQNWDCSQN